MTKQAGYTASDEWVEVGRVVGGWGDIPNYLESKVLKPAAPQGFIRPGSRRKEVYSKGDQARLLCFVGLGILLLFCFVVFLFVGWLRVLLLQGLVDFLFWGLRIVCFAYLVLVEKLRALIYFIVCTCTEIMRFHKYVQLTWDD